MARYLFTSTSDTVGGAFLLDSKTEEIRTLHPSPLRGITRGPDGAFYLLSGTRNRQDVPMEEHRSEVFRLDPRTWEVRRLAEFRVGDAHDLRWFGGHFYLVASLGNQILRLDPELRLLDRMQIVEDDRDVCHVNCLGVRDGQLHCSIFTLSPGDRREKRLTRRWQREGKILRLDYPNRSYEVVYEPLGQPHSLHWREDGWYLAESHFSRITRVDPHRGSAVVLGTYTGFVRALGFGPDEAVIGVSRLMRRDRARSRFLPELHVWWEKLRAFSGFLIADPRTWRVRRRIAFPGVEPYDIVPVDEPAACP